MFALRRQLILYLKGAKPKVVALVSYLKVKKKSASSKGEDYRRTVS